MAGADWRSIPTVLYPQEILDKAFSRASRQSDFVEDPDKYHRVRKQMAVSYTHLTLPTKA